MNIYGNYFHTQAEIELAIDGIRAAIGSLPITSDNEKKNNEANAEAASHPKVHFKTKILEDGSYQTEMIEEKQG